MTNLPPSSYHIGAGAQQARSQGNSSLGRRHAWDHVQENRGSPSTGSQSFSSEQNMDADDPPNKDHDMQTLKNTTALLSNLEGFQSLVELSKQELMSIKQSLSIKTSDENALLKEELEKLKIHNRKLQQHHQEISINTRDRERINYLEEEIKTANVNADESQNAFRDISQKHEQELAKTKVLDQTLKENKAKMDKMVSEYESRMSDLQKLYEKAREEKKKSEADLAESRTRLSRLMGNKLANNNPDIADLSDKNRPTKIAERNQELYDNEWTNAFEVIQKHVNSENRTIETLFQMLQNIKTQCDVIAKEQEQKLYEAVKLKSSRESLPEHVLKQLKDFRRYTAEVSLPEVIERCFKAVADKYNNRILKDGDVQKFLHGCVELCWLMNIQDPPLAFAETQNSDDAYDCNTYKFYTETGPLVDFIVWPALLLQKDGSLLSKGIAQAHGRQQAESNTMKNAESQWKNEALSNPPEHLKAAPSDQSMDRHIAETGSQCSYQDQERPSSKEEYRQSAVSGQTNNTTPLSSVTKELVISSNADKINKSVGRLQRERVSRQHPVRPDFVSWKRFKQVVRTYGIDSPMVKQDLGEKYNICKEYYIYKNSEKGETMV